MGARVPPAPRVRRAAPAPASLRLAIVGLCTGALAGCELTSVELADRVDVVVAEVYLRPGEAFHQAFLHRTVAGPEGHVRVEGARIVVQGPDGLELRFVPDQELRCVGYEHDDGEGMGSCYTVPDDPRVRPGGSYHLEIVLEDGRRIEGRTTVPEAFEIVRPAASPCVLEGNTLELVWTRAAGAWAYQADAVFIGLAEGLAARGVTDPPDTLRLLGLAVGVNDTTIAFPQEFGVFERFQLDIEVLRALQEGLPSGARAELVVAAGDRNYVNWVRGGNFNPSGQIRISSLQGDGIGVFGALLGRSRTVESPGEDTGGMDWPACD
jgi:hypothetical protein